MTKKERDAALAKLTVITDSREKQNNHILDYFKSQNIPYTENKLIFGDYSVILPTDDNKILLPIWFDQLIAIERKANLEELSINLAQQRERFEDEFKRAAGARLFLMIEGDQGYADIMNHKYNTELKPAAYMASLLTLMIRYNLNVSFVPKNLAGRFIYRTIYYFCYEWLKLEYP